MADVSSSLQNAEQFASSIPEIRKFPGGGNEGPDVLLVDKGNHVQLDNGIVQVTISKPGGIVNGIQYGGLDNLLERHNHENDRGYWDLNWSVPDGNDIFDVIIGTQYQVIDASPEKVEISFVRNYDPLSNAMMVPLNLDKRFVLLRGNAGFYSYGIYEHPAGWADFNLNQTRITFKLRKDRIKDDGILQPTTWQIKFELDEVIKIGVYKLRIALAAANLGNIQVRVNDPSAMPPPFETGVIGKDNAIARHGIHGLYHLFNISIDPDMLQEGSLFWIFRVPLHSTTQLCQCKSRQHI